MPKIQYVGLELLRSLVLCVDLRVLLLAFAVKILDRRAINYVQVIKFKVVVSRKFPDINGPNKDV